MAERRNRKLPVETRGDGCSTGRSPKRRIRWSPSMDAPMGRSRAAAIIIMVLAMGVAYAWLRGETGNAAFAIAGASLAALPFLFSLRCMLDPCGR